MRNTIFALVLLAWAPSLTWAHVPGVHVATPVTWDAFIGVLVLLVLAQIIIPNAFTAGTVADSDKVNANFTTVGTNALNRTGGAVTGNITASPGVTFDGVDVSAAGAGGIAIAGQTALDLITAGSATQLARTAAGTALQYPRINAAGTAWEFATPAGSSPLVLLKSGSGTSTAAGATTVDSVALPALTALDTIELFWTVESVTQNTAQPLLYHVTDGATLQPLHEAQPVGTGGPGSGRLCLRQFKSNANLISSSGHSSYTAAPNSFNAKYTATAAWTSGWTLGLRHGGVTAGGTFYWSWSVYKLAGQ